MAIEVKHGPSPAAVLTSAYGGAQGKRRGQAQLTYAKALERRREEEKKRRASAFQQKRQNDFREQEGIKSREFQEAMTAKRIDSDQQTRVEQNRSAEERMLLGHSLRQDEAETNLHNRSELMKQEADLRQEQFEKGYTFKQEQELKKLAEAEAELQTDVTLSKEDKEEARRQIKLKKLGIKQVDKPRKKTAKEKFEENTVRDTKTGAIFSIDEKGLPSKKPIFQPPPRQLSPQDQLKLYDNAQKASLKEDGTLDNNKFNQYINDYLTRFGHGKVGSPQESAPVENPGSEMTFDEKVKKNAELINQPEFDPGTLEEGEELVGDLNKNIENDLSGLDVDQDELKALPDSSLKNSLQVAQNRVDELKASKPVKKKHPNKFTKSGRDWDYEHKQQEWQKKFDAAQKELSEKQKTLEMAEAKNKFSKYRRR